MNRNQLVILSAAGTAAAVAWGAVLLQDSAEPGNESVAPSISSTATLPAHVEPEAPRTTVPTELRVPTIEPGRGGTPRGGVPRAVANDTAAIGAAFVRTMWTYDTAMDTTSRDAAARAARWATAPLSSALVRPATRTTPQWDEWVSHDAFTGVSVTPASAPGQDVETTERLRTYRVDVRVVGSDGYRDRLEPFVVIATLVREDGRWLVERIALT